MYKATYIISKQDIRTFWFDDIDQVQNYADKVNPIYFKVVQQSKNKKKRKTDGSETDRIS